MSTMTAPSASSVTTAEYINPVIVATRQVFEMMLGCTPTRTGLKLQDDGWPRHEVSGVIGISGAVAGMVVVNLSATAAREVLKRMVGSESDEVNQEVCDAVGELTNMIAGSAKAQLAKQNLSISLPNVVSGPGHIIHFPSDVRPMVISFNSELGPLTIEVGFSGL